MTESLPSGVLKVAELLPCPFCGVTPVIERCADSHDGLYGERKWWGIKCRSTLNRGGTCAVQISPQASIDAATERWNRRASPPPQATGAQPHPEPSEEASSLPVVISTAPERIYLVVGEDCPPDARWDQLAEVLWCEDNIDGNGVVYERSDLAQSQLNAMRVERDAAREHLARSEGLLAIAIKQNENADRHALKAAQKEGD